MSVGATWLAALPGDASSPSQPVLLGSTQGTANSTGYISIPDVVLQGAAGVYNLSLTLLNHPEVYISSVVKIVRFAMVRMVKAHPNVVVMAIWSILHCA